MKSVVGSIDFGDRPNDYLSECDLDDDRVILGTGETERVTLKGNTWSLNIGNS